jgi:hypothetical protein
MVAVIDAPASTIVLYPKLSSAGSLDGAIAQAVGASPTSVVHKQVKDKGYFLATCQGDNALYVLDDKTSAVVKKIALSAPTPLEVAAPLSADAAVAYVAFKQKGIGRVDLEKMVDQGLMQLSDDQDYSFEITCSPDGRLLYTRRIGVSPKGFAAYRVIPPAKEGDPAKASQIRYEHDTRSTYVPDPFGQMVACGQVLYNRELSGQIAQLPQTPVAFSDKRTVFFAVKEPQVTAYSYNTFKPLGSITLPEPEIPESKLDIPPAKGNETPQQLAQRQRRIADRRRELRDQQRQQNRSQSCIAARGRVRRRWSITSTRRTARCWRTLTIRCLSRRWRISNSPMSRSSPLTSKAQRICA